MSRPSCSATNPRAEDLKITTWNINSVRLRMPLVAHFLKTRAPDVLCLQETKCRDAEFPMKDFHALGYRHVAINGQKGYHGVAVVSKKPLRFVEKRDFCEKGDARHIAVEIEAKSGPIMLHNFYVPAGGDEPDVEINPKFAHKLDFLDEMKSWIETEGVTKGRVALVGDLNIAPLEHDVWSHKALLKVVSHTPVEVEKLTDVFRAGRWIDAMRHFVPADEKLYTWWSYRAADWAASNRGRRLDHILVSEALGGALSRLDVLQEARGWERPSDHVPVTIELSE
ncbi:exodeoxyribonuclease III [Methylocystis sp. WRRC1]|uniref:exodeoxyribonuclease III n=1 Tax=unclassified Methylocystis TaxID=2625913 RepID=UPI0005628E98|nr:MULTISPECIES: exodeoxyribonuclease III [unclassified Methylocystis]MCC3244124.1 exodeoxyribonuclease III [Methylocystis sp. WRRC1]